jgi:hypothetical protein
MNSGATEVARLSDRLAVRVVVPDCDPFVAPLLFTIPIQLLAYHVAVFKGTEVDQPCNPAKSVTVEEHRSAAPVAGAAGNGRRLAGVLTSRSGHPRASIYAARS